VILRPGTGEDAADIAALEGSIFGVDAWSLPSVLSELSGEDRFTVVAIVDGAMVGYAITMRADDVVDLLRIAVHPSHQRHGVAHALLAATLDRARSDRAHRMLLEVSADNSAAVAFYAREGFVEIDRRRGYYRDRTDALVLRKVLGGAACGGRGWAHGQR
jgi:ribosomal-protein-alanine N-acetyltransferase